jgi:hypothetical protein
MLRGDFKGRNLFAPAIETLYRNPFFVNKIIVLQFAPPALWDGTAKEHPMTRVNSSATFFFNQK